MGAFLYRLEQEDGTPADPPTLKTAVPDWRPGDTIPLGREKTLRVMDTRLRENSDGDPVLAFGSAPAPCQNPRREKG
jgi:hypothetical protein